MVYELDPNLRGPWNRQDLLGDRLGSAQKTYKEGAMPLGEPGSAPRSLEADRAAWGGCIGCTLHTVKGPIFKDKAIDAPSPRAVWETSSVAMSGRSFQFSPLHPCPSLQVSSCPGTSAPNLLTWKGRQGGRELYGSVCYDVKELLERLRREAGGLWTAGCP